MGNFLRKNSAKGLAELKLFKKFSKQYGFSVLITKKSASHGLCGLSSLYMAEVSLLTRNKIHFEKKKNCKTSVDYTHVWISYVRKIIIIVVI